MTHNIITSYSIYVDLLYLILGIILPSLFLGAILIWTISDGQYLRKSDAKPLNFSHSEPIVLLFIGAAFLYINRSPLQALPAATLIRLAGDPSTANNSTLNFSYIAYTIATLALCASLAKAFWTHVRLEQHHWGMLDYYKAFQQRSGWVRGLELLLRCVIALIVVLLQKQLSVLKYVDHIDKVKNPHGIPQENEVAFVASFAEWQAHFSTLFFFMYLAIIAWSVLANRVNMQAATKVPAELPILKNAFAGTLWSTVPGLFAAWLLFVTATGRIIPTFHSKMPVNLNEVWIITVVSGLIILVGFIIIINLGYVLFTQVWPVVRDSINRSTSTTASKEA